MMVNSYKKLIIPVSVILSNMM